MEKNKPLSLEQIVANTYNANAGFRARICDRTIETYTQGETIPDTLIFHLLAARLYAANIPAEETYLALLTIADLIRNGHPHQ